MDVNLIHHGREILFQLRLDRDEGLVAEGQQGMRIELVTDIASVRLPLPVERPHPDLLGLAALVITRPWCRRRLRLSEGVSARFADAVWTSFSIEVSPVDSALSPRSPGDRFGLLYSGGPDCMAAETLVGEQLPLFHFRRVKHPRVPNRATHHRADVQETLVRKVEDMGEELHVARSDLEYLCKPFPTFPQWTAVTVGAVIEADDAGLGGLVTGRNMSGMYLNWGHRFAPTGEQEREWERVYAAVGLPLIQPLAGASDISSKRIAQDHRLSSLSRSCLLGTVGAPCLQCKKCLLTELIQSSASGAPLNSTLNSNFLEQDSLLKLVNGDVPLSNQHIFEYAMARIPDIEKTFLVDIFRRLRPTVAETEWVSLYYQPAISAHLPEALVETVLSVVNDYVGFMPDTDIKRLEQWDPAVRTRTA